MIQYVFYHILLLATEPSKVLYVLATDQFKQQSTAYCHQSWKSVFFFLGCWREGYFVIYIYIYIDIYMVGTVQAEGSWQPILWL